jgi:hypothetical protein
MNRPLPILMLDSVYNSNEYNHFRNLSLTNGQKLEKEIEKIKIQISSTKNKRKIQTFQKELVELEIGLKVQKESRREEFENLQPDGYLLLECCSIENRMKPKTNPNSNPNPKPNLNSTMEPRESLKKKLNSSRSLIPIPSLNSSRSRNPIPSLDPISSTSDLKAETMTTSLLRPKVIN